MSVNNRFENEQRLIAQSFTDNALKIRLQGDPQLALEDFLGAPLPAGVGVKVYVEDQQTLYINLPNPALAFMGDIAPSANLPPTCRKAWEAQLIASLADATTQSSFMSDPTAMVRSQLPNLPANVAVQLLQEPANTVFIIVPYQGQKSFVI